MTGSLSGAVVGVLAPRGEETVAALVEVLRRRGARVRVLSPVPADLAPAAFDAIVWAHGAAPRALQGAVLSEGGLWVDRSGRSVHDGPRASFALSSDASDLELAAALEAAYRRHRPELVEEAGAASFPSSDAPAGALGR